MIPAIQNPIAADAEAALASARGGALPLDSVLNGKTNEDVKAEVASSGPEETASKILSLSEKSTEGLLRSCQAIYFAFAVFTGVALDVFVKKLREAKFLPKSDEVAPKAKNSKLSMLKKIGQWAHILLHEKILPLLIGAPAHSSLYQVALLTEAIPGDEPSKVRQLSEILDALDGDLRRETLIGCRNALAQSEIQEQSSEPHGSNNASPPNDSVNAGATGGNADLVVASLTPAVLRWFERDYADPSFLDRGLVVPPIAKDAVFVIFARLTDYPVIQTEVLWRYGFARSTRLMLIHRASGPDLLDAQIAIVAERGDASVVLPEKSWLADDDSFNPIAIAEALFPTAKTKHSVFASAQTDGWFTTVGDANWRAGLLP